MKKTKTEIMLGHKFIDIFIVIYIPLAMYGFINQLYGFIDMSYASVLGADSVSAIVFIDQVISFIHAIGYGIGISSGVIIAKYIGQKSKQAANEFITVALMITMFIALLICILGSIYPDEILRILSLPDELVSVGTSYFIIQMITLLFVYFNAFYLGLERARGNSNRILILNVVVVFFKIGFLSVLNRNDLITIEMIAITTLISQLFITVVGIISTFNVNQAYSFKFVNINFKRVYIKELILLGVPIVISRSIFSLGKLIVNIQAAYYGAIAIGALGISNKLSGLVASFAMGFEEAESVVVSANRGASNYQNIQKVMKKTLIASFIVGTIGYVFMNFFYYDIISFFAKGDEEFYVMLDSILKFEIYGLFLLPIINAVTGVLYGLGRSKVTLILSFIRLFILRIPLIWLFIHFTTIGPSALGISMLISNVTSALMMIGVYIFYIMPLLKKEITKM